MRVRCIYPLVVPACAVAVCVAVKLDLYMHRLVCAAVSMERWSAHRVGGNKLVELIAMILHEPAVEAVKHGRQQFNITHTCGVDPKERAMLPQEIEDWHKVRVMGEVRVSSRWESTLLD